MGESHLTLRRPLTKFGFESARCCRQLVLDAALSFPPASPCLASPPLTLNLLFNFFGVYRLASIFGSTLFKLSYMPMPVLEKNIDHEPNRDHEREKDRDREGKDREKGPKSKSSTKSSAY
jgi:hypothetical protein